MANVALLSADLLFGSQVQGALSAAGHEVRTVGDGQRLRERLSDEAQPTVDVLVVDLTDEALCGASIVESLAGTAALGATRTLGFYSHVDVAAREAAERAGFDVVVPRSRMAREGAELVARLAVS